MKGFEIYISYKQSELMIEAIDMLEDCYEEGHPEIIDLKKLKDKICCKRIMILYKKGLEE